MWSKVSFGRALFRDFNGARYLIRFSHTRRYQLFRNGVVIAGNFPSIESTKDFFNSHIKGASNGHLHQSDVRSGQVDLDF